MFFSAKGEYLPCGMFSIGHFILIIITSLAIYIAIKHTKNKDKNQVYKIIKTLTIIICILELLKIIFVLFIEKAYNVNEFLPLYYCSLLIYAGLLSSFGKGKIKRAGDVFLATGAIVGGTVFIIFPSTTLPAYPMLHCLSLYSFLFHGIMVYLGLLINITQYIELQKSDIKYYSTLVTIICIVAYFINIKFDSNLMFISRNFPGTILEVSYNILGPFYTLVISLVQIVLPFYFIYYAKEIIKKKKLVRLVNYSTLK